MKLLLLCVITLPNICFANLSGFWVGTTEMKTWQNTPDYQGYYEDKCENAIFEIKQNDDEFIVVMMDLGVTNLNTCGKGFNIFTGLVLENGNFYSIYYPTNEQFEVGNYSNQHATINFGLLPNLAKDYGKEQWLFQFELTKNGELKFSEWDKETDGSFERKITATLTRK